MRSSTSSFDREIPGRPWGRIGFAVALATLVFLVSWELYWRSQGYVPSYNDTPQLWASQRQRLVSEGKTATVLAGASRVLFDIDSEVWTEELGEKPIYLGICGGSARPVLEDLAGEEHFSGTLVCGVMPGLFFSLGPPYFNGMDFVNYYHRKWSPASKLSFWVARPLESNLAFLNKDLLSFDGLITQWLTKNDPNATPPIQVSTIRADRRNLMLPQLESDPQFRERIRKVYKIMLGYGRTPPEPMIQKMLGLVKDSTDRIRARGGKILFVRFPSTDYYREVENEKWPRAQFWDRLLEVTGVPGIHFEDYPELTGFECPEWSHLKPEDAMKFTKAFLPIYKEVMARHYP